MAEKTHPLSDWTYPDFPKPDNELERINRITELSLEQFPKSEILQNVCEIASLVTQCHMVAVTVVAKDKQFILAHELSAVDRVAGGATAAGVSPGRRGSPVLSKLGGRSFFKYDAKRGKFYSFWPDKGAVARPGSVADEIAHVRLGGSDAGDHPHVTVRHRGMGTGISEASKRVPIFSFATQGGKQVSSHFRQGN